MSQTAFTKSIIATTLLSAIALTGCSPSEDTDTITTPTPFSATATGVAAKGIIKFATVTAYELDASGNTVRTVGTSETDVSGKYLLTIGSSYTGGPLKLVLSYKDASTKMVCDVSTGCGSGVAFGQDYTLSPTFTLAAYQQAASSGATVKTQITPYSDMAVARIEAQIAGGSPLNNTLVANAISEVNQIVGVDIANTEPIDITNPVAVAAAGADALQYAAFNAGVGKVAFANAGGFEAGISAASNSFSDGQFDATDTAFSIAQLVTAVDAEVTNLSTNNPTVSTTTITATTAAITVASSSGTYNPDPVPTATLTAVAQARGLVSQTRTWGTSFTALKTPTDAFGLDMNTASAVLNSNSGALGGVFSEVLGGALNKVVMESSSVSGLTATAYPYTITYWTSTGPVNGNATVTVSDNSGNVKLNISATNIAGVSSNGTVTTNIPSSVLGVSGAIPSLASLTMTVSGGASMTTPSAASITLTNAAVNVALKTGKTTSTTSVATDIQSIGFDGNLSMAANGVTFTGTGNFNMVANSVLGAKAPFSMETIAINGTFTGTTGSANASASLKFNNAATFDTIGLMSHQPVIWDNQWMTGDTLGVAATYAAAYGGDILQQASYSSMYNQTCLQGTNANTIWTCMPGDIAGVMAAFKVHVASRYNPAPLSAQNVYAYYQNGMTSYNAMLTFADFETASNFANATLTVSSGVTLSGYPAATLTATANRTAYGSSIDPLVGDVVAVLAYNGQSVKIEANNTTGTGTGALTITNPDNVKLIFNGSTGSVSVDGTTVGTIESGVGMPLIRYNDGTFESLN